MKHKIPEIKISYSSNTENKVKITDSKIAFNAFITYWNIDTIELLEEFKIILLNKANEILGIHHLSKGGTSSTYIDIKLLFSIALKCNASSIIVAHNHPSGNIKPSKSDKDITNKIKKASKLLSIELLDHLVITKDNYYSFVDKGIL